MKPVEFAEQTKVLRRPPSMTDAECGPLPVWNGDGRQCISCWRGGLKERLVFLFTGRMYCGIVSGETQPPVWVSPISPFVKR